MCLHTSTPLPSPPLLKHKFTLLCRPTPTLWYVAVHAYLYVLCVCFLMCLFVCMLHIVRTSEYSFYIYYFRKDEGKINNRVTIHYSESKNRVNDDACLNSSTCATRRLRSLSIVLPNQFLCFLKFFKKIIYLDISTPLLKNNFFILLYVVLLFAEFGY